MSLNLLLDMTRRGILLSMAATEHRTAATHEVTNQPPPLEHFDTFSTNRPLVEALRREGGAWAHDRCVELGRAWGGEPLEWGRLANEHPPKLRTHDRFGNRIDEVEFHPAWHKLMALGSESELHSLPWTSDQQGAHVARSAMYLCAQADAGFGCPITMTFAAIPALRGGAPELAAEWEPLLMAPSYDGQLRPAADKGSAKCGMAMTEKQGGSDVRANTTTATPLDGEGEYTLRGHKWFCSAPMCDVFLVLAQADEGVTCFLVPRILPDGTRNPFKLQRLKDKLGNRSNASSEVEFDGTWGQIVGEPGRGVPTIIEMVAHTRLDCVLGSTGGMHAAVANAAWHVAHRSAFGKLLADQPLMRNVLADLSIESEAATVLALRLARAYDEDERARQAARHGGVEVPRLQALPEPGVRGDGVPRRQRLRGGVRDAAHLPRGPAELDLGGLWERQRARRAARAREGAGSARGLPRRGQPRRTAPTPASTRSCRT